MTMPLRMTLAMQSVQAKPNRKIAMPNALAMLQERARTDAFSYDVLVKLGATPGYPRPAEGPQMSPEERERETVRRFQKAR